MKRDNKCSNIIYNLFMLNATIRNGEVNGSDGKVNFDNLNKLELLVYKAIAANPDAARADLVEALDIPAMNLCNKLLHKFCTKYLLY